MRGVMAIACALLGGAAAAQEQEQPPAGLRLERTGFHALADRVHALSWTADGRFVAAAGGTASAVLDRAGEKVASFAGPHAFAPGPAGPELWIAEKRCVRRWSATTRNDVGEHVLYGEGFALRLGLLGPFVQSGMAASPLVVLEQGRRFAVAGELAVVDGKGNTTPLPPPCEPGVIPPVTVTLCCHEGRGLLAVLRAPAPSCFVPMERRGRAPRVELEVYDRQLTRVHAEQLKQGGTALAFDAGGNRLALTSHDGELALLDTRTWRRIDSALVQNPLKKPLHWVAFLDDETLLVHDGRHLAQWNARPLRHVAEVVAAAPGPPGADKITAAALSPDATHLAVARDRDVTIARIVR